MLFQHHRCKERSQHIQMFTTILSVYVHTIYINKMCKTGIQYIHARYITYPSTTYIKLLLDLFMVIKQNWWFQPIWKICSSNWNISPGIQVKRKNIWLSTTYLEPKLTHILEEFTPPKKIFWNSPKKMVNPPRLWMFPKIVVPPNQSIINHPFWGTPIFGNTHIMMNSLIEINGGGVGGRIPPWTFIFHVCFGDSQKSDLLVLVGNLKLFTYVYLRYLLIFFSNVCMDCMDICIMYFLDWRSEMIQMCSYMCIYI